MPVILDAGIGTASDTAPAMEALGCDAVLLGHRRDPGPRSRADGPGHAPGGRGGPAGVRCRANLRRLYAEASTSFDGLPGYAHTD